MKRVPAKRRLDAAAVTAVARERQPDRAVAWEGRGSRGGLWAAAGVFGLALAVRVVYLAESSDYPAFSIPISDARDYDAAARQWVSGAGMPTQFFWQPFFYPFFLSCVYAVTGGAVVGAKVVQVVLGAATCALTCVLGQRLFGRTTGTVAGLITAFYGPLIFYDAELLTAGWATFWAPALVLLFLAARARQSGWVCLALGVAGGASTLTRPEFLPYFLAGCAWLARALLTAPAGWRQRLARCAALPAGFALVTLPVAALNARVTGHFGFLPYSGGVNLYLGNHPEPDKAATTVDFEWDHLVRLPLRDGITDAHERNRYFYRQTLAYARDDPAGLAGRLLGKTWQLLTSREIPRSVNVYVVRQWSFVQTLLTWKVQGFGFPFGVLLPLALVGLVVGCRRVPVPMALFLVLYPLGIVLVFVTARYRLPLVPLLAILAAAGGVTLAGWVKSRDWRSLSLAAVGGASVALLATLPGPFPLESDANDRGADMYLGLGHYHLIHGDRRAAVDNYEKAIALAPESVPALSALGALLTAMGRPDEGQVHLERAWRLKPHLAATHNNYGLALLRAGRLAEAADRFREAVTIEPDEAQYHANLGAALVEQKEFAAAVSALRAAVRLAPREIGYRYQLGMGLTELGEHAEAVEVLRAARQLNPDDVRARYGLGVALEHAGRPDEAAQEYRAALRLNPRHALARQRLESLLTRSPRP